MSNRGTDLMALFPGLILPYAGNADPAAGSGWLLCNGAAVSRTTYAGLFAAIGTTFGVGDNITTFNLPDLRGRCVVGTGQGSGLTNRAHGATGGAETHQLTDAEMPSHTHVVNLRSDTGTGAGYANNNGNSDGSQTNFNSNAAGGDAAHNNMQPFMALRYVIKT